MLVGAARDFLQGGTLFRFDLKWGRTGRFDVPLHNENDDDQGREFGGRRDRFRLTRTLAFSDPRLQDRVADNLDKFDITESESLLFGTNFGIVTDIHTAPDGKVYVVSLSHGAVYKIHRVK